MPDLLWPGGVVETLTGAFSIDVIGNALLTPTRFETRDTGCYALTVIGWQWWAGRALRYWVARTYSRGVVEPALGLAWN